MLVELALIFPVLLVLLFGIIDFGKLIREQNTVVEASRHAARSAVGAALSPAGQFEICGGAFPPSPTFVEHSCDAVPAITDVRSAAVAAACSYLRATFARADDAQWTTQDQDWMVRAAYQLVDDEDPALPFEAYRFVRLEVSQRPDSTPRCFFCRLGVDAFRLSAQSEFLMPCN